MRTSAADCLSTPLTSQMVGWTWTCSESESSSLLCHTGVPLAAPHLSVTLCLRYICAASVSHLGCPSAKMTVSDVLLLSYVPICPICTILLCIPTALSAHWTNHTLCRVEGILSPVNQLYTCYLTFKVWSCSQKTKKQTPSSLLQLLAEMLVYLPGKDSKGFVLES